MVKLSLKILPFEHRKIFKVCLAIFNIMHELVKVFSIVDTSGQTLASHDN